MDLLETARQDASDLLVSNSVPVDRVTTETSDKMGLQELPPDIVAIHLLPKLSLRCLSSLSLTARVFHRLANAELPLRWPALGKAFSPREAFGLCRKLLRLVVANNTEKLAAALYSARARDVPWAELGVFLGKTLSCEHYCSSPTRSGLVITQAPELTICLAKIVFELARLSSEPPSDVARVLRGSLVVRNPFSSQLFARLVQFELATTLVEDSPAAKREFGRIMWSVGYLGNGASGELVRVDPLFREGWEEQRRKELG